MKQFIFRNWYRLTMALATLIFSLGFFVWAVKNNPAKAGDPYETKFTAKPPGQLLVIGTAVYRVYWDDFSSKFEFKEVTRY